MLWLFNAFNLLGLISNVTDMHIYKNVVKADFYVISEPVYYFSFCLTCRVRSSLRIVQTSRKGQRSGTRMPSRPLHLSSRSPRMSLFRRCASGSLPQGQPRSFIKVTLRNRRTMEGMPLPRYRTRLIYLNIGNKCNLNWSIDRQLIQCNVSLWFSSIYFI